MALVSVFFNCNVYIYPFVVVAVLGFDVQAGEFPENIKEFNGVLITGSLSGVYQEDAWIQRLLDVRYSSYPLSLWHRRAASNASWRVALYWEFICSHPLVLLFIHP
jgi:hypothetical protein